MKDPLSMVRDEVRAIAAYSLLPEIDAPLVAKLDFNESPLDVPDELKDRILARLKARRWGYYPAFGAMELRAALARRMGRPAEEIVPGNGSGELIAAALSILARPGTTLVLPKPAFSLYFQVAALAGMTVATLPLNPPDFSLDEDAFLKLCEKNAPAVPLLCSPNNPTGGTVSREFARRLAEVSPVILCDQAYVEFARPEFDFLPLLDAVPGLVIFRTFSKAFSAAGFRIGYAVARSPLVDELRKAVLPFNVDIAAESFAAELLSDPTFSEESVAAVTRERERFAVALRGLGASVAPSEANFLFFSMPGVDPARLRRHCLLNGVRVRDLGTPDLPYLRVTVGKPEENDLFLRLVKEFE
ncbi:MAG: histidinol-phosphate aminotransferase family protein [Thermoanaerobaculia bacterium]|nr:histidinol-phosphate aminotransferase family protein [Thermoanaerobaculia bacterium]